MNVVIIGGGSAGSTCAFELRKLNKDVNINILESTSYYEYSPCALPYVISKEIESLEKIYIYDRKDYEANNINLMLNSKVYEIDFVNKKVFFNDDEFIKYDKLVIATGAKPFVPKIENLDEYLTLKTPNDVRAIEEAISRNDKFLIVGGGMVGVEVAEAINKRDKDVTIIESSSHLLSSMLDSDMSKILKEKLLEDGIKVLENERLEMYSKDLGKVILCTGVIPNDNFLLSKNKGYVVSNKLETNIKDVYACGDVVNSTNAITKEKFLSGLGTTAVRQGILVARNILEFDESFEEVLNNTISKISNLYVGSVGVTSLDCKNNNITSVTSKAKSPVRAHYYSREEQIVVKLIVSMEYKILGAQIIGDAEVSGRLNLLALAISEGIDVKRLSKLETCYNPASAAIFDPITVACNTVIKKIDALKKRGV